MEAIDSFSGLDLDFRLNLCTKFYRIKKSDVIFNSEEYKRPKRLNNYTVSYRDKDCNEKFGVIEFFIELQDTTSSTTAVVAKMKMFKCEKLCCSNITMPR